MRVPFGPGKRPRLICPRLKVCSRVGSRFVRERYCFRQRFQNTAVIVIEYGYNIAVTLLTTFDDYFETKPVRRSFPYISRRSFHISHTPSVPITSTEFAGTGSLWNS